MAEVIGIASGIAGLVALAAQITKLSYSFVLDVKSASRTRKQFLQEVSAFTDILLRAEEVFQDAETLGLVPKRPVSLSDTAFADCRRQLSSLHSTLERHSESRRLLWPFLEISRTEAAFGRSAKVPPHVFRSCLRKYPVSGCIYISHLLQFRSRVGSSSTAIGIPRETDSLPAIESRTGSAKTPQLAAETGRHQFQASTVFLLRDREMVSGTRGLPELVRQCTLNLVVLWPPWCWQVAAPVYCHSRPFGKGD